MTLLLDPDIRDWVVLPLFVLMVAAGLLRHALGQYLQGEFEAKPRIVQRAQNKAAQLSRIRSGAAHYLTTDQWRARKQHAVQMLQQEADWCEKAQAEEEENKKEDDDPMSQMLGNPLGMMKGNMAFMVQK
jgi:ER membrane protein complex subunit 3